jgi:O-antigen/teichoic acid export membrane protein
VVLSRLLDPADFGRMAILLVILAIGSTFSEFGLSSAIVQKPSVRREDLATLYTIGLISGAAVFSFFWISAPLLDALISMGGMTDLIRGTAFVFLIAPWGVQFQALLQKSVNFRLICSANVSGLTIGTVVAIALAELGLGVWALLYGYLTTQAVTTALLVVVGIRRGFWSGFGWNLSSASSYLKFGGLRLAAMLANTVNARADQLLIGSLMGAVSLGLYNVAYRLVIEPVQRVNPIVTRVAFPVFSVAQQEPQRLRRGYLRMLTLLLSVNAPLLLGLAATAHVAVRVFLGPKWEGTAVLVQILCAYGLLRTIGNAAGSVILARGRADWSFYWNLSLLLFVPATVWFAAKMTGTPSGVAVGLVSLYSIVLTIHYFMLIRPLVGPCGVLYLSSIARPTVTAGLMAGCVRGCDLLITASLAPLPRLIVLVGVGILAYVGLSVLLNRELLIEGLELVMRKPWAAGAKTTD